MCLKLLDIFHSIYGHLRENNDMFISRAYPGFSKGRGEEPNAVSDKQRANRADRKKED